MGLFTVYESLISTLKDVFGVPYTGTHQIHAIEKFSVLFVGVITIYQNVQLKKQKEILNVDIVKDSMLAAPINVNFFRLPKKIENKSKSGKISLDETRKQYNSLNKKDLISLNKLVDTDEKDKGLSAKTEKRNQNINSNDYDSDDSYISINNSFSCLTEDELSDDDPDEVGFWPSSPKKTNISKNLRNNKSNNKKIIKGNKQDEIQQSSSKDYSLPKPLSDKSVLSKKENANILVEKTLFSNIVKGNKAENQKKN